MIHDKSNAQADILSNVFKDDYNRNIVKLILEYPEECFWYFTFDKGELSDKHRWETNLGVDFNSEDSINDFHIIAKLIKGIFVNKKVTVHGY